MSAKQESHEVVGMVSLPCYLLEEVNHEDFNTDHTNVHDKISPSCSIHPDWIDIGCEKPSTSDEELLDGNTARSFGVGKEFYHVRIGERIISNIVPWAVEKDEENDCNSCCLIVTPCCDGSLDVTHGDGPCDVDKLETSVVI